LTASGKKVVVLDTSAFVAGFDPFSVSEIQYTVPMVEMEFLGKHVARMRFKTAIESGKLEIMEPDEAFIEKVKASASILGDFSFLSETDIRVLALALQLRTRGLNPLIATDDYSIQNVAKHLGIEFAPLATFGIRRLLRWIRYCPACRRKYPADYESKTCEVCGTKLKRKPAKQHKNKEETLNELHGKKCCLFSDSRKAKYGHIVESC
jgi:UPF0271 protein